MSDDDAKTLAELRCTVKLSRRHVLSIPTDQFCDAVALLERLAADNARKDAEIERLRPKPLNCFEVWDLFNANEFKGRTDWRLFSEGDSEFHVGTESGHGGYFDHEVADAIAQGLLRDAGPIAAPLEPATGEGEAGE